MPYNPSDDIVDDEDWLGDSEEESYKLDDQAEQEVIIRGLEKRGLF